MACKFGCKGAKCKYDNSNWPPEKMAISGIFSNWFVLKLIKYPVFQRNFCNLNNLQG